jgi:hypothetical protein
METTKDSPLAKSIAVKRQEPAATLMRDCMGGTARMRELATQGERNYLPKNPRESLEAYQRRVDVSVFHNAVGLTVEGLTGMVFRRPIALGDDAPVEITGGETGGGYWEDIDLAGRHGNVFCQDWFSDGCLTGHSICFVDQAPRVPDGESRAAEREIRPYWTIVRKDQVLRAEAVRVGGKTMLGRLAWVETTVEPDGQYGQKEVLKIREYFLTSAGVAYQVLRQEDKDKERFSVEAEGILMISEGRPYPEIPAAVFYAKRTGFMESSPPLEALAYENVRHFQIASDDDNIEHVSKVPQLIVAGVSDVDFPTATKSSHNVWRFDSTDAKVYVVQVNAEAAKIGRETERESEKRMAVHGLALIRRNDATVSTATQDRIQKSEEDARLVNQAERFQDAVETALGFTALWMGLEKQQGGSAHVNRDFVGQLLSPEEMRAWLEAYDKGAVSQETMWDVLKAGGRLPDSFDPEEEARRLDVQVMRTMPRVAVPDDEQDPDMEEAA